MDAFKVIKWRQSHIAWHGYWKWGLGGGRLMIAWSAPLFFSFPYILLLVAILLCLPSLFWHFSCSSCLLRFEIYHGRTWQKFTTMQLKPQRACMTLTWEMVPAQSQKLMRTWGKVTQPPAIGGFESMSLPFSCVHLGFGFSLPVRGDCHHPPRDTRG